MYDAIQIKYIPATNTKGSKLRAFTCHDKPNGGIIHPWDYNYRDGGIQELARFYCQQKGWDFDDYVAGWLPNGDIVYVRQPRELRAAA